MKSITKEPKTKWQLAVAIEVLAERLRYNAWGSKRMRTTNYDYFTKSELRAEYESLLVEAGLTGVPFSC